MSTTMKPSDDIASEIVGRYAWTGNVMYKGRLVGQQVLVAQDICEAIERERAENARLRALVMLGDFSSLRPNSESFKLVQQIRRERSTGEQSFQRKDEP